MLKRSRYFDRGISGGQTSAAHVVSLLTDLTAKGIHIKSIGDGIDSTTTTGRAMLQMTPWAPH